MDHVPSRVGSNTPTCSCFMSPKPQLHASARSYGPAGVKRLYPYITSIMRHELVFYVVNSNN